VPSPSSAAGQAARTRSVARIGMIAAVYASLTLVTVLFLGSLAWGPVQLRVSEAVCVLALFTSDAIPGLALGCAIANLANIVISGTARLVFSTWSSVRLRPPSGHGFSWRHRDKTVLALAGPVIANALIVPRTYPFCSKASASIPFPSPPSSLDVPICPCIFSGRLHGHRRGHRHLCARTASRSGSRGRVVLRSQLGDSSGFE